MFKANRDLPLDDQNNGPSTLQIALRRLISHGVTDNLYNRLMRFMPSKMRDVELNHAQIDGLLIPRINATLEAASQNENPKTVLDFVSKQYKAELTDGAKSQPSSHFIDTVLSHVKIFLFAGHDTTAMVLSWAYWYVVRS
jgi:hypothetical protein